MNGARQPVERLLAAIESRDLRRVASAIAPDATWQNVPHPPAEGRDGVIAMLAGILRWSDEVRWDVSSAAYDEHTGWVERVDRFWIDGDHYAVRCNGVFVTDRDAGVVTAVRDYVDLGEWRARIAPAYDRMANRRADAVVARHLAAVRRREPVAMAADYALDAVLVRGDDEHRGWRAIAEYFEGVPARLGNRAIELGSPRAVADETGPADVVEVEWTIRDGRLAVASGRDRYTVASGWITRQVVALDGDDF